MNPSREQAVTEAFVSLSSALVTGRDVIDLLTELTTTCGRLLHIDSAGLLLADPRGTLHLMAASAEDTREVELYQLQRDEGPCRDAYQDGAPVSVADLGAAHHRWPQFAPVAQAAGFASVHAMPMRLRERVLGALGLFGTTPGPLSEEDLSLAQALADVASVALVHSKETADSQQLNKQLQAALTSRVVLEQAKGVLAQLGDLSMDQAFTVLRQHARSRNLRLTDLATAIANRTMPAQHLLSTGTRLPSTRPIIPD